MEAISYNPHLSSTEKHVLHEIAAMMDIANPIDDRRWIRMEELAVRTSLSERTLYRTLNSLQASGYLIRSRRTAPGRKELLPSRFGLTEKIFAEYADLKQQEAKVKPLFQDDSTY